MSDLQDIRTVPAADLSQRRLHDRVFRPIEPAFSLIGVEDRNPRSGLGHTEGVLEGIVSMSTRVENVAIVLGNHIPHCNTVRTAEHIAAGDAETGATALTTVLKRLLTT